ncbi:MAG: hypothetical protein IT330_15265 [Anaerolineae bacterium]|nr:hypothetical protein [Anaerolineae bacterium]
MNKTDSGSGAVELLETVLGLVDLFSPAHFRRRMNALAIIAFHMLVGWIAISFFRYAFQYAYSTVAVTGLYLAVAILGLLWLGALVPLVLWWRVYTLRLCVAPGAWFVTFILFATLWASTFEDTGPLRGGG